MSKKILILLMAVVMIFAFSAVAMADDTVVYTIKIGNETVTTNNQEFYLSSTGSSQTVTGTKTVTAEADGSVTTTKVDVGINATPPAGGTISINNDKLQATKVGKYICTLLPDGGEGKNIIVYVGSGETGITAVNASGAKNGSDNAGCSSKATLSGTTYTVYVDENADTVDVAVDLKGANATYTITPATDTADPSTAKADKAKFEDLDVATEYKITVYPENGDTSKEYTLKFSATYDLVSVANMKMNGDSEVNGTIDDGDNYEVLYPFGTKAGATFEFTFDITGTMDVDVSSNDTDYVTVSNTTSGFKVEFEIAPDGQTIDLFVTVKAMDGSNKIEFEVEMKEADPVLLDDLDIMIGSTSTSKDLAYTMYPGSFDDRTLEYYVFVPYSEAQNSYKTAVDVYFNIYADDDYTIKIDNSSYTDNDDYKKAGSVNDGTSKTFNITATYDGTTTTYSIKVYYAAEKDNDTATLKTLSAKYGSGYKTTAAISPAFAATTTAYSIEVPTGTTSVKLTADTTRSKAEMFCNDERFTSSFVVSDLKAGANKVEIDVVAEDCKTIKTYTVTINVGSSSLTGLSFTTNAGTTPISPAFNSATLNYIANVTNASSVIYVTPTASAGSVLYVFTANGVYQSVTSGGTSTAITLKEGLNEIKIMTGTGTNIKTYCLSVYRQPAATKYQVSSQKVTLNGQAKDLYAVNINGNNFIKLRDIAYLLNGSAKQINVSFNAAANSAYISSNTAYSSQDGTENKPIKLANPQLSAQKFYLNNQIMYPIAYNINQNNYVNLRQLCAALNIGLTYSATTNTITLNTSLAYVAGQ